MSTFFIPGKPFGKQSVARSKFGHRFVASKTRASMKKAAACFLESRGERFTGAVEMTVTAYFQRPKSHYGTGRFLARLKEWAVKLFCTSKPDLSNIAKGIEDGLNKLAYKDDAYIVDMHYHKRYANINELVGVFVTIEKAMWRDKATLRLEHRQPLTSPRNG